MGSQDFNKLLFDVKGLNRRVLVVEDDSDCSFIIRKTIEECSRQIGEALNISFAQSFDEAVAISRKNVFDVVISDIKLFGHETGLAFYDYCRNQKMTCIFIFVSGTESAQYHDHFEGETSRWPIYLAKPIQPSQLSRCIQSEIKRTTNGKYSV